MFQFLKRHIIKATKDFISSTPRLCPTALPLFCLRQQPTKLETPVHRRYRLPGQSSRSAEITFQVQNSGDI